MDNTLTYIYGCTNKESYIESYNVTNFNWNAPFIMRNLKIESNEFNVTINWTLAGDNR
jgi:hypothetical protein